MLPKIARLKSGLSIRSRCCLLFCGMALLAVPTWYLQAQPPAEPPASKSDPAAADKSADKSAARSKPVATSASKSATSIPPAAVQRPALQAMAPPSIEYLPEPSSVEKEILQKLNEQAEFDFNDETLLGICDFLNERHALLCVIDRQALEDNGIRVDASDTTLKVSGITLRSALNLVLKPNHLAFIIDDEVVKITTIEAASTNLITRTYPVRDLVGNVDVDYHLLSRAIQDAVGGSPYSPWVESGGEGGTVSVLPATGTLVIRQTANAHDEILKLLRSLRQANLELRPKTSRVIPSRKTGIAGTQPAKQIDCQLLNVRVSDAKYYPLVGAGRMVTAHLKCTLDSDAGREVVYVDSSRLIPVN